MRGISSFTSTFRFPFTSAFKSKPGAKPSGSDKERAESQAALPPSDPGLRRSKSKPIHLPSTMPERTPVKPARPPISRALPDTNPPKHFGDRVKGIFRLFSSKATMKAAREKELHYRWKISRFMWEENLDEVKKNPELMGIIKKRHPGFDYYDPYRQAGTLHLISNHPQYFILLAKIANEKHQLPSGPTATRMMTAAEQKFLTNAHREINEQTRKNPYHIHGETAVNGTRDGKISRLNYNPGNSVDSRPEIGDKFDLHTHPPFAEPLTSAASLADHQSAAFLYTQDNRKTLSYVSNGKDILHIRPDSTELTRLIPNPKLEKKLGKFPVAFEVPKPQKPPYPFSNHEAPGAL